jgi:hypothetical protein
LGLELPVANSKKGGSVSRWSVARFGVVAALAIVALGSACGGSVDSARCDDVRQQILAAREANIENGTLLYTAIPCGEDGIANRPDYFDPRVAVGDVELLQSEFGNACDELALACGFDEDL